MGIGDYCWRLVYNDVYVVAIDGYGRIVIDIDGCWSILVASVRSCLQFIAIDCH